MNIVERKYRSHVTSMSGKERVARTVALFDDIYEMIARRSTSAEVDLPARELKRRIAMQLYRSDQATQRLLERSSNGTI